MTEQRMVTVELLELAEYAIRELAEEVRDLRNHAHAAYQPTCAELRAIINGPGVEPFAYYVYFPDAQDGEFCAELDDLIDRLTNERHEVTPLVDPSAPVQAVPPTQTTEEK